MLLRTVPTEAVVLASSSSLLAASELDERPKESAAEDCSEEVVNDTLREDRSLLVEKLGTLASVEVKELDTDNPESEALDGMSDAEDRTTPKAVPLKDGMLDSKSDETDKDELASSRLLALLLIKADDEESA